MYSKISPGTWFSPTTGDINSQNMDYMLYLVAGLVSVTALLYLVVSSCCYRVSDPMSFGELEKPEFPGTKMTSTNGDDWGHRSANGGC